MKFAGFREPLLRALTNQLITMSAHDEKETWRKRPINKATMDGPQEEFIEAAAATVDTDEEHLSAVQHVSHSDRLEEKAKKAG